MNYKVKPKMILVIPTLFSISVQVINNLPLDFMNDLCFQRDQRHYKVSFPNCFQFFVCFYSRAIVFPFLFRLFSVVIDSFEILNLLRFECSDRVVFFVFPSLVWIVSFPILFCCSEPSMDLSIGLVSHWHHLAHWS